jgi:hypothetical protein
MYFFHYEPPPPTKNNETHSLLTRGNLILAAYQESYIIFVISGHLGKVMTNSAKKILEGIRTIFKEAHNGKVPKIKL